VQRSTLKRAQSQLAMEGFYRSSVDGEPGPETERALMEFQREASLPPTGRLDMDTLSEMRLLPNRRIIAPRPVSPYVEREQRIVVPQRRVYRGIWIR
jgi:peptidoglycan hydrolase-like protein with peptidoglycan-binding domain